MKELFDYRQKAFWIMIALIVAISLAIYFVALSKRDTFYLHLTAPANSESQMVYSEEEISPLEDEIIIAAGDGLADTEYVLVPSDRTVPDEEAEAQAQYLTSGLTASIPASADTWYRLGLRLENPTDEDMDAPVFVAQARMREADSASPHPS